VNKLFALFVPPAVVTNTLAVPAVLEPILAFMVVELTTVKVMTETPPMVTAVAPVKLVPVIAIEVPPDMEPLDGETLATVGAGTT